MRVLLDSIRNKRKFIKRIRALSEPYKGAYIQKEGKKLIIRRAELIN